MSPCETLVACPFLARYDISPSAELLSLTTACTLAGGKPPLFTLTPDMLLGSDMLPVHLGNPSGSSPLRYSYCCCALACCPITSRSPPSKTSVVHCSTHTKETEVIPLGSNRANRVAMYAPQNRTPFLSPPDDKPAFILDWYY